MSTTVVEPEAESLGGHRLVEKIGEGGMQEVFRTAAGLVLKRVSPDFARHCAPFSTLEGRRREHAKVVRSYRMLAGVAGVERLVEDGRDTPTGEPFAVFDFVAGQELEAWAESVHVGQASPAGKVLRCARVLFETLANVHSRGVVHHDLKPDNVLVDAAGQPTIIDFGASLRLATAAPEQRLPLGNRDFMAPERIAQGWKIGSPATDVYEAARSLTWCLDQLSPARWHSRVRKALAPALADDPLARPTAVQMAEQLARYSSPLVAAFGWFRGVVRSKTAKRGEDVETNQSTKAGYAGLPRRTALALGAAGLLLQVTAVGLAWQRRHAARTSEVSVVTAPAPQLVRASAGMPVESQGRAEPQLARLDAREEPVSVAATVAAQISARVPVAVSGSDSVPFSAQPVGTTVPSTEASKVCDLVEVIVDPDGWRRVRPCQPRE